MKTEIIHCDVCGYKFAPVEHWSAAPASVALRLQSPPRQQYESVSLKHACFKCVESIKNAVDRAISLRKAEAERHAGANVEEG